MASTVVGTGEAALETLATTHVDLVLLDLGLPGVDGHEVTRRLRQRLETPIVVVSARTDEADKVLALESGADDYVSKPFSTRELVARVRAHVRRSRGQVTATKPEVRYGGFVIDPARLTVSIDERPVRLTAGEFAVLYALASRPGRVVGRERLLELARGSTEESFDRSIDVTIFRIRQKLEQEPERPRWLRTVRGAGYVFAPPGDDE